MFDYFSQYIIIFAPKKANGFHDTIQVCRTFGFGQFICLKALCVNQKQSIFGFDARHAVRASAFIYAITIGA